MKVLKSLCCLVFFLSRFEKLEDFFSRVSLYLSVMVQYGKLEYVSQSAELLFSFLGSWWQTDIIAHRTSLGRLTAGRHRARVLGEAAHALYITNAYVCTGNNTARKQPWWDPMFSCMRIFLCQAFQMSRTTGTHPREVSETRENAKET